MGVLEKAIISANDILEYIPQRAPIVMVDSFFGVDGNVSVCGLTIADDNIFNELGVFGECGVMEHIAQSAAMRMGYVYKNLGREIPLGYIGSIDKLKIFCLPDVGDTIKTEIAVEQEIMNITLVSAKVKRGDDLVAECKMKIYLQE